MKYWESLSLRSKLTVLLFIGLLVPMGTGLGIVAVRDIRSFREDLISTTSLAAAVASEYSAAALAFQDEVAARQTLVRLASLPELEFATIQDARGHLLASYRRPGVPGGVPLPVVPVEGRWVRLDARHLNVIQPVIHEGVRYGSLRVQASAVPLQARINAYLLGILVVAVGVAGLSLGLAFLLQRLITRRILALAEVARVVAEKGDYSVRARKVSDDEIGFLADTFNTMLVEVGRRQREAQEAIRVREEFLSIASHELRTPLTPLKLEVQSLTRAAARGTLSDQGTGLLQRDLGLIGKQLRRLETLIYNLLDVSRITSGKLQLDLEEVDLVALLQEAIQRLSEECRTSQTVISLEVEQPVVGRWDPARLDQVLSNLLGNALKYGAGRPIEVGVGQRDGTAWLSVRDHGVGIAEEDQARIFDRFERAVSVRHYGGLGLGLYIAQSIAASHGGRIRVESQQGAGATFIVELPVEGPPWEGSRDVEADASHPTH
ncbi:HAMP domain-containing protein [Pyxidicoccus parkwayensis]|uniref:histidine kinase n=1 Tax=Pyxidicoccus parkwayensis TaxID=2813578 RepID=A0ABX7P263_9BACT|nr:ATP-binding protein [Pyxidicoccus parkwaysis]QSQ24466.1 HAMP domain-containing protein [Pyxidicoccus parkwaysis]